MDNKTLLIALGIIAISYAVFFGLLSTRRKDKTLFVFTVGYISALFVVIFTYFQTEWPMFFGVILLNVVYFILLFTLSGGFKVRFGLPLLNKNIVIHFFVFLVFLLFFTYVVPHFSVRIIISSVMSFVVIYDNYVDLKKAIKSNAASIKKVADTVMLIFLIVSVSRIIYASITFQSEGVLIEQTSFTTVTNIFMFISLNVWSLLILSLDYMQFLRKLHDQNDLLAKIALKDSLTGLYNRHFLEQEITRYFEISKSYHQPLSFIMFDLDNFKIVNDVFGHDYGDEVLKIVADTTLQNIQPSDIAVRWGGEEFLIILPDKDIKKAEITAETLRIKVQAALKDKKGQVTISLGVTEYNENDSGLTWFRRADYGLSQAKKTGKNKFVSWPKNQPLPQAFATVEWNNSWNSGHEKIDKQHKALIEESNKLAIIALDKENKEIIINQLEHILNSTIDHFKFEENLLYTIGYELYEEHHQEHQSLIDYFNKLIEETRLDKITVKNCFDQIVGTLIIGHLLHYDKLYFPYFQNEKKN